MSMPWPRLLYPVALTLSATLSTTLVNASGEANAVTDAYVGPLTQAKQDAALSGLNELTSRLSLLPTVYCCDFPTTGWGGSVGTNVSSGNLRLPPVMGVGAGIEASGDQDLGVPGAAVTLDDGTFLRALATFSTPRDFIIGSNDGIIDTNGYDLTITGNLEAFGELSKVGDGILTLAGNSQWHDHELSVWGGVLRGGADSLQTSIYNQAVVDFYQQQDGVYGYVLSGWGDMKKTGLGTLSLSGANKIEGNVYIDEGRLALIDEGSLGVDSSGVDIWPVNYPTDVIIASGATIDLSATAKQTIGALAGNGEVVLGEALLIVDQSQETVFGGVISGPGHVTKTGPNTLTLTGINTYSGSTVIGSGTLALAGAGRLNPDSSLYVYGGIFDISGADGGREFGSLTGWGDGTVNLGSNTMTIGRDNQDTTFEGAIVGSGGLIKIGNGSLTLGGSNSFTGLTTIREGALFARAEGLSNLVENDATLILYENSTNPSSLAAYSGSISGSGQVVKEGWGKLWLRGTNTYTGGTTVNSGTLIGNTDSLQGAIDNHALTAFYQVADGTHSGQISGNGTLCAFGPGTLTLDGTNTYTGGTIFSNTLQVADDANLGDAAGGMLLVGGTLRISHDFSSSRSIALADLDDSFSTFDTNGHDMTLTGPISGPGSLIKEGGGTLTLEGQNTFVGSTEVQNGRLSVGGTLTGDLLVDAGAEAGGAGVIGGSLVNHGRLARGTSIGQITVGGDVNFAPGSFFTVKVDAAGNSDKLVLTGSDSIATLDGGTVDVQAGAGNYRYYTDFAIISAPGGINGKFGAVTSNLAFLDPKLAYGSNSVALSLTRNDVSFESVATNDDQRSLARILGGLEGSGGDLGLVMNEFNLLSAAEACQAFDSIAGRERAALPQVNLLNQRALAQVAVGRLGRVAADNSSRGRSVPRVAGGNLQFAANDLIASDAPALYAMAGYPPGGETGRYPDYLNSLWMQGFGGAGEIDATAPGPDYSYTMGGVALGYDRALGKNATLGLLGAYSKPRLEQVPNLTKTTSSQIGAYGNYHQDAVSADLIVTFSQERSESSRQITFGGLTRQAVADYDGNGNTITSEVRYTLGIEQFTVQPLIGLQWSSQRQDAYTEEGAGALNLVVPAETIESLRSTLGMGVGHSPAMGEDGLSYGGRVGWVHEFQDQDAAGASLSGDPSGTLFSLTGEDMPRDSAQLGLGLSYTTSPALRLYLDLNSEFNDVRHEYSLTAGVGYRW